jgi:hypothetical protein
MPSAALPSDPSDPSIPNAPVTAAILDSLREIVGDKGLILDEHDKQPFVTDWRAAGWEHRLDGRCHTLAHA